MAMVVTIYSSCSRRKCTHELVLIVFVNLIQVEIEGNYLLCETKKDNYSNNLFFSHF